MKVIVYVFLPAECSTLGSELEESVLVICE